MDAYRVNPPLPRMVAAIPLLFDGPKIEYHRAKSPYLRNEYSFAQDWLNGDAQAVRRHLFLARTTVLIFFAIGLWTMHRWASRLYGHTAGTLAMVMWGLNPDIVANAAVVAPDLPAASTGLLACYLYWDWLHRAERPFPWLPSLGVSLAILCKFSWLLLLPLLPFITILHDCWVQRGNETGAGRVLRDSTRLIVSFLLCVWVVNLCYGFDGFGKRLGEFEFVSEPLAGNIESGVTGNRFANGRLGAMPVPLPKDTLQGIDYLKWEFEKGMPCYLRGEWKERGWWYFYLYAMAVKMPLGYWLLIAVGLGSVVTSSIKKRRFEYDCFLAIVAIVFVAWISSQLGFTHHVRYVIPAYGFLFILATRVTQILSTRQLLVVVSICVAGPCYFHTTHAGLAHTYFNALAGGPNSGWKHLGHSNVDWGQSTYRMIDWVNAHPEQRPMTVLFRSTPGNPNDLVDGVSSIVEWKSTVGSRDPSSGWYLISSFEMTQEQNQVFAKMTPHSQPYPDVLLFHVSDKKNEQDN